MRHISRKRKRADCWQKWTASQDWEMNAKWRRQTTQNMWKHQNKKHSTHRKVWEKHKTRMESYWCHSNHFIRKIGKRGKRGLAEEIMEAVRDKAQLQSKFYNLPVFLLFFKLFICCSSKLDFCVLCLQSTARFFSTVLAFVTCAALFLLPPSLTKASCFSKTLSNQKELRSRGKTKDIGLVFTRKCRFDRSFLGVQWDGGRVWLAKDRLWPTLAKPTLAILIFRLWPNPTLAKPTLARKIWPTLANLNWPTLAKPVLTYSNWPILATFSVLECWHWLWPIECWPTLANFSTDFGQSWSWPTLAKPTLANFLTDFGQF